MAKIYRFEKKVENFVWIKGENDIEYIHLLEKALKEQTKLTCKAVAKLRMQKKELTCDETQEIRTVLKNIHEMMTEAEENNMCDNDTELSRMAEEYLPIIEDSYKYFVERGTK